MNTDAKLKFKGFSELVEQMEKLPSPYKTQLAPIFEQFKAVMEYMKDLETTETGSDLDVAMKKLDEGRKTLKELFQSLCESQGKSVEEAYREIEDPQNYKQQEWEEAQAIRREVEEKLAGSPAAVKAPMDWTKPKANKRKLKQGE